MLSSRLSRYPIRCRSAIGGEESDTYLLLLDARFGGLLDVGPNLADVGGVTVGFDGDGLHEEFVSAARIWGWIFFHRGRALCGRSWGARSIYAVSVHCDIARRAVASM